MNRRFWCILSAGLFALSASTALRAQEEDRGPRHGPRARAGQEAGGGLDPAMYVRMLEKLEKDTVQVLQPDGPQAEDLEAIFADYIEEVRSQVESQRERRREHAEEMRELMKEMRDAQAEGNRDRVGELREQLAEMREQRQEVEPIHDALFAEVRDLLDDAQREKFEPLARSFEDRIAELDQRPGDLLRAMQKVAATLNLSPEQREAVRGILMDAMRARSRGPRDSAAAERDSAAAEEAAAETRKAILDELDEEQGRLFEERLAQVIQKPETARPPGRAGRRGDIQPDPEQSPDGDVNTNG